MDDTQSDSHTPGTEYCLCRRDRFRETDLPHPLRTAAEVGHSAPGESDAPRELMGSLIDQTEVALGRVLGLCSGGGIVQQDVEALQRHDEAALALLDVNDGDAMKALRPWTKCLEAWARKGRSTTPDQGNQGGEEGPWTTITQPCAAVLSRTGSPLPPQVPSAGPPLAAHKALPVVLFRVMLLGDDVEGSPHRTPSPAAWAAARAYLLMLSLPGAAAYGVLQPAVMGMVLTNLRSWCRNSGVYRPGGDAAGKKKAPQKRRRAEDGAEGSDDDGDSDGVGGRRAAGKGGGGDRAGVQACLELLKGCLSTVSLASHQDLAVKLSEVLVGVSVVASVEGPAFSSLASIASESMVGLVIAGASGGHPHSGNPIHGAVLQALMPVILMATGKPDVPPRNRDCVKAHQSAIEIAKTIASALRNTAPHGSDEALRSPPSTPGQSTNVAPGESTQKQQTDSAAKTPGRGDASDSSPTGDAPSATPSSTKPADSTESGVMSPARVGVVGRKSDGNSGGKSGGGASPVLTMVQHLCVSAPERAEGRARLAEGLATLLPELEGSDRARFVSFLAKLSRSAKILHRGFAVELSSRLLTEAWSWAIDHNGWSPSAVSSPSGNGDAGIPSPGFADGGGKTMLDLVVARAADTAPTVRSKAASTLADVIAGIQGQRNGYKGEAFRRAVTEACGWGEGGTESRRDGPLLQVVRTRVEDEKANVRRNAVPALEALLKLSPAFGGGGTTGGGGAAGKEYMYEEDFLLLQERCNDVSLSTRKAAMGALSSLLMLKPTDDALQAAWVSSVLPLAADPEQTCQDRLVDLVRTVLLDRVVDWHKAGIENAAASAKTKGRGGKQPARAVKSAGVSDDGSVEDVAGVAAEEANAKRVSSVWSLLAKAGQGDAQKCLKKAVSVLMMQKGTTGFKATPLLKALRAAAVMALPPKAATVASAAAGSETHGKGEAHNEEKEEQEQEEEEESEEWAAGDLRLLSLAEKLPTPTLTMIRRGTWVLLDAFFDRVLAPGQSSGKGGKEQADMGTLDPMFVVRCWNRIRGHIVEQALSAPIGDSGDSSPGPEEAFESDGRRVLAVLARLASNVPAEVAVPLAESLLEMLLDLVATPETSAALVAALHMICFAQTDTEEAGAAMCNQWANEALQKFERLLDLFVYQGSEAFQDHSGARACGFDMALLVERLVFAVGEVALVGFTGKEDAAGPSDPRAPGTAKSKKQKVPEITVRPTASPRLVELVQMLLPPRLPTSAHGVEEGEQGPEIPSPVRALAFVTLGKLCLRDKALAKRSVNLFVRELDTAAAPAVRSNALVVLGDLCVRYTAMVDRHVAAMAACLQDSHPMVRRHAILLISQLLLQDYVKWRGLLLYRFLATIVDSDASVRNLGAFTLTQPLITKTPGLFAQNFVETLFVLNNYSEHPCYAAAAAGRVDAGGGITMEGIDLGGDGPGQIRKRMSVYSTMLDHMSDEKKITVTAKLAQEVLSAAIDGGLPLADTSSAAFAGGGKKQGGAGSPETRKKASAVVKDALTIMASPGIRVDGGRGGAADGADLDDGVEDMGSQQPGQGGLAAAKRSLLSKVALKHLMEKVVPILTALKHVLERAHSPLLRELMFYFGELFRSHKEEVKAVLASEPGLVNEIDFDLRRFEKEEHERRRKAKEAAAATAAAAAVSVSGMGPPRTPRRRRSSMGGAASGRRNSFAPTSLRDACTPMAAVVKSARKTSFQNLGACSAVKLKPPTPATSMFSPVRPSRASVGGSGLGGRTGRPKTPVHLRTPRQAVAAALGNSPMDTDTSPVPIRSMLSRADNAEVSASSGSAAGKSGSGDRADIELDSPSIPHPAKKKRGSESAAPLPAREVSSGGKVFNNDNGVIGWETPRMRPLAKEGDRDRDNAGDEKEGAGKENHPNPVVSTVVSTRAASDGNRRVTKERSSKGKGEGGSGVKSFRASPVPSSASDAAVAAAATPAAGTSALNTVAGKQKKKTAAVRGGAREVEKSGKNKTSSRNRAAKKETSAVVSSKRAAASTTATKPEKATATAAAAPGRRSSRAGRK